VPAHVRLKSKDLIPGYLVQVRLQLEIDERDEPANPLAAFKFGPLFYERHRVAATAATSALGLRYARGLCHSEF